MTAGPRWGSSIAGAWTTYTVTVRNDGSSELDADVVLVADDPAPTPAAPSSLARRWPAYRTRLTVFGGGTTKTLTTVLLEAPYGYRAELRERPGRLVASAPAIAPHGGVGRYAVALLSAVPGAGKTLGAAPGVFEGNLVVTQLASTGEVPRHAIDFIGLDAIVIDDFNTEGLAPDQLGALGDFVSLGGSLVVAGGAASARTIAPLPPGLVPLRATRAQNSSMAPLGDLISRSTDASSTVGVGELQGGRSVLGGKGGPPLVVVAEHGAGQVAQLAYDPLVEPFASDAVLRGVAFDQGLARVLPPTGFAIQKPLLTPDNKLGPVPIGPAPVESSSSAASGAPTRRVLLRSGPTRSPAVLVVYIVVLVAYGLIMLRQRRRRPLVWLATTATTALVAVVAVVATHPDVTGLTGFTPRGERLLQIETVSPTGAVLVNSYEALSISNSAVALAADTGASTVFVPAVVGGRGRDLRMPTSDINAVYGTGGGEIVREPPVSELRRTTTESPSLQTIAIDHGSPGLEADLRRTGLDAASGRLVGTVTNRGSRPLYRLRAQLSASNQVFQAPLAGLLAPGATIQVDAPLMVPARWCYLPDCPGVGSSARGRVEDDVMFVAASQAIGREGQIGLAALVDAPPAVPDPDGSPPPIRAAVQTVWMRGAYGHQLDGRPVASAGLASVATLDVNVSRDATERPSLGTLRTDSGDRRPIDVFDWESHSWRRLGIGGELRPSEYSSGIVRARIQGPEPLFQVFVSVAGAP